jgi:hypothetical protein
MLVPGQAERSQQRPEEPRQHGAIPIVSGDFLVGAHHHLQH